MTNPNPILRGGMQVSRQQAEIVDHVCSNPLTIVDAGAGSGKTRTTVATVLELLGREPTLPIDRFVLITFTNQAADELRARLEEQLTERLAEAATPEERRRWADSRERLSNAYIGTIHGFCRQVLRAFGYGSLVARESDVDFSRAPLFEAASDALEEALSATGDRPPYSAIGTSLHVRDLRESAIEIHNHIRNRGISPSQVVSLTEAQPDDAGKPVRVGVARLVMRLDEFYSGKKSARQMVDSTDLLLFTAELLEGPREPGVADKLSRRYRYIFIDEFQDTDRVQMRIADSLRGKMAGVLLVGDEKQSIYRFRGAGMRLSELAAERGVPTLPLSISRRPTRKLLELQNTLFDVVGTRYPALGNLLEAPDDAIDPVTTLPALTYVNAGVDDQLEGRISATASALCRLIGQPFDTKQGVRTLEQGHIAILFRSNNKLEQYEQGLGEILPPEVQVRKEAGGQFFRRPEIVWAYRLLNLLVEYPNDVVLAQALATPYLRARIDPAAIEREVLQFGRGDRGLPLTRWFEDNHPEEFDALRTLRVTTRSNSAPEILELIYEQFQLREFHLERGQVDAVDNLERLREMARNLTSTEQALLTRTFAQWLRTRLLSGYDEPDAAANEGSNRLPPYVRLMTVHAAKGLEFPVVIIPEVQVPVVAGAWNVDYVVDEHFGLDLRLPSLGQTESARFNQLTARDTAEDREEAMRVFYVAVTRAQNAVLFIGSGPRVMARENTHPKYAWIDEIRRAWLQLRQNGAVLVDG